MPKRKIRKQEIYKFTKKGVFYDISKILGLLPDK